ncbi:LCP family protein [Streptomyces apocyni]|uniref:LCP family protein n=1 Tax=Streptomyces apocyni TaxID=2654677 RepID=UPI0018D172FE|nr:LCP family protein [Streptomyces apocyni]
MGRGSVRAQEVEHRDRHADGDLGKDPRREAGDDDQPPTRGATRGARRGARPRRRKGRILLWGTTALAGLVLVAAGGGYLYLRHLDNNIKTSPMPDKGRAAEHTPNAAGQTPLNILVIGSDARDSEANQKLGGAKETFGSPPLADVQMLIHLSADRSNMSVVSMPRDTLLEIPECRDPETGKVYPASTGRTMTNLSLGRGGPGCTVATWEKLTDIRIDHFIKLDFAGVVSMADAVGGVPVCVEDNIHSLTRTGKGSGLKLEAGTTKVKGEQALQWLRTRYGFEDGTDISRAKAQHMYMSAMVRELRANATLTNPGKMLNLAEKATSVLEVDEGLDKVKKLYDLSTELKKVDPKRMTMTTMPWQYAVVDRNRVEPKPGEAEQMFRLIREDIALDGKDSEDSKDSKKKTKPTEEVSVDPVGEPADTGVLVRNGTGTDVQAPVRGRATAVAQLLVGKGYTLAAADGAPTPAQERTRISYPSPDLEGDAQAVAKALGLPLSSVRQSTDVTGITVVVGADWREGDTPKKASEGSEGAGGDDNKAPESADLLNGADDEECMPVDPNFTWE